MAAIWGIPLSGFVWGAGRVNRKQFWIVFGLQWAVSFGVGFVGGFLGALLHAPALVATVILVGGLIGVWVGACNVVRRLHDLGRSGWWLLLALPAFLAAGFAVAVVHEATHGSGTTEQWGRYVGYVMGGALVIFMGSLPGQAGPNRFGAGPDLREAATFD